MPMFRNLGVPELILILAIALLFLGPGRIGRLGSELGKGIRGFREGLGAGKKKEEEEKQAEIEGEEES